jgi:hypothetical protein
MYTQRVGNEGVGGMNKGEGWLSVKVLRKWTTRLAFSKRPTLLPWSLSGHSAPSDNVIIL